MANDSILALIDAEIARLTQVRSLLSNVGKVATKITERKTKKSEVAATAKTKTVKAKAKKTRVLSPEARKRIADAQRKRWAAQKAKA
jgi:hypothetical protein